MHHVAPLIFTDKVLCNVLHSTLRQAISRTATGLNVIATVQDFDRLRSGTMHENHFTSALSIAGLDRFLSSQQIGTIAAAYRVQVTASLTMVDWVRFADDVEQIFTIKACFVAARCMACCMSR